MLVLGSLASELDQAGDERGQLLALFNDVGEQLLAV